MQLQAKLAVALEHEISDPEISIERKTDRKSYY